MATLSSEEGIDNWAKLGKPGWTHENLAPYYKKFQTFTEPSQENAKFYHTAEVIEKDLHDRNSPVKTSFPLTKRYTGDAWVKTFDIFA